MSTDTDKISELEAEIKRLNKLLERLKADSRIQIATIHQQADLLAGAFAELQEMKEALEQAGLELPDSDHSDGRNIN